MYSDGSLSIKAWNWLVGGYREACSEATPGGSTKTIPCQKLGTGYQSQLVDCVILRLVRLGEVRTYIAELRRHHGGVRCEDGTPLAALGVS